MEFLIHFSILNFYLSSHDVYKLDIHNTHLFKKFVLDHTVTNSTPGGSINDLENEC